MNNIYYYVVFNKANKMYMQTNYKFNTTEPTRAYLFTYEEYARDCAASFRDKNVVPMSVKLNVAGVYELEVIS